MLRVSTMTANLYDDDDDHAYWQKKCCAFEETQQR